MHRIVLHLKGNCAELKTPIPKGVELVIRDYDIEPEIADATDADGPYVERTHTEFDNPKRL